MTREKGGIKGGVRGVCAAILSDWSGSHQPVVGDMKGSSPEVGAKLVQPVQIQPAPPAYNAKVETPNPIAETPTDPTAFDSARLHFPTKVNLAVALGTVDRADVRAFTALNGLRLRFAHDVGTKLTDQHELNLYNALSRRQRGFVDKLRKPQMTLLVRLRSDIAGLIRTLS